MPLGRMRRPSAALRVMLNAVAVGILLFLVWDVLSAAWEPIDEALAGHHETGAGWAAPSATALLFAGGLTVGLLGLSAYERWMGRAVRRSRRSRARPGRAWRVGELTAARGIAAWSSARQPGAADRGRHRPAQLRRGPGDRPGRRRRARSRWPPCW